MTKDAVDQYVRQTKQALILSISVAVLLMAVKFTTGFMTHSMAIIASALDSTLDMMMSVLNFFAFLAASKPPDEEHAYGHGKVESLAALFQSLLILISGAFVVYESVKRLVQGSYITEISLGIGVIVFSGLATFLLSWRLGILSQQNRSLILGTEKVHYSMDFACYVGIILALLLVEKTGQAFWDLVVSILIAGYIFYSAIRILLRAIAELLDRGLSDTELGKIRMLILRHHPSIVGVHNLRSRIVGNQIFLDFHIEIREENNFKVAHDMTESLIAMIKKEHPNTDITVHFDPEGE